MKFFNHSAARPHRQGFTLIELLVVIEIIALLAAILFPVFARARENARRSSCQSNLKQIGLGILQYSQDYDERFPGFVYNAPQPDWTTQIYAYTRNANIYQCPSEPTPQGTSTFQPFTVTANFADFFYNRLLTSYNVAANADLGINQAVFRSTSLTIVSGDWRSNNATSGLPYYLAPADGSDCAGVLGDTPTGMSCDSRALDRTAATRHLGGANYLFADGHVKFCRTSQIYGAATSWSVSDNSPTFRVRP